MRFYHGFATAIFVPVTEATIAERFPAKQGERISLFNSATAIGRGIAPFLGGYILLLTSYSYHTLYLTVGVVGTTALFITLLFLAEGKNPTTQVGDSKKVTRRMFQGWYELAKNRGVLVVSFIQASQYYVYGGVEFFLVGYLSEVVKIDPLSIGTITGSQIVALIILRPFMGRVSDKIGRKIPIILGSVISCLLLLAFPFTTQFPLLVLLSIGYGLGFAMVISSTSPLISELAPDTLVGTSMGFLSTMMDVGQTLGPIISGLILATSLQYVGIFSSFSLLLVISGAIFIVSGVIKQRHPRNNKKNLKTK